MYLFLNRKEVKQVLGSIGTNRKAEEENEKRARTLRQQLKTYAEEKEQELEIIQINNRQQLKQLVEEKEQFEKQELEKEKMKLKAEADKVQATLKDQYQKASESSNRCNH